MSTSPPRQPFLDRAIEGYRAGVKAWSRDVLLAGLALFLAGAFITAPYLGWSAERAQVEGERAGALASQEALEAALGQLEGLANSVAATKATLAARAEQLARELSERLRRFAGLVRSLGPDGGAPGPLTGPEALSNFPGANMAQQFALPMVQQQMLPVLGPAEALQVDYGLDAAAVQELRRALTAGPETPAWQAASALTERVFRAEIERTYALLDREVAERLGALERTLASGLEAFAGASASLGLVLPAPDQLAPNATVVHLPSDDELFRTVGGKVEALRHLALYEVGLDLDAAEAPLRQVAGVVADSAARLEEQRAVLEARRTAVEGQLGALEARLQVLRAELGSVAGPLQWLALDATTFVQLYPTLLAAAFLWLAHRHRRLQALRRRLEADYREIGLSERDVRLALYVPEAALGDLETGARSVWARLARPLLVAVLVVSVLAITIWIQQSPVATDASVWGWHLAAAVLAGLGSWLVLHGARSPAT